MTSRAFREFLWERTVIVKSAWAGFKPASTATVRRGVAVGGETEGLLDEIIGGVKNEP